MRYAVPVFLINGFLESGKTSFINNAILSDPEVKKSRTLIILCEEGEVEPKEQKNLFVYRVDGRDFLAESLLSPTELLLSLTVCGEWTHFMICACQKTGDMLNSLP